MYLKSGHFPTSWFFFDYELSEDNKQKPHVAIKKTQNQNLRVKLKVRQYKNTRWDAESFFWPRKLQKHKLCG